MSYDLVAADWYDMVEMRNHNTKRPQLVASKNLHPHDLKVFPKRHYCGRMPHFVKKQGCNLAHCLVLYQQMQPEMSRVVEEGRLVTPGSLI